MRAALVLVPVLGLAILAGGCSKHDAASGDVRNVGHQLDQAASNVGHNTQVRQAEAGLRQAGRDASHDLHKAATEARDAFHNLANEAHHTVHQATGHDSSDHNSNNNG